MKRVMLQTYVSDASAAIELYEKAFDAKLLEIHHGPNGGVFHSELDVDGQTLAVADRGNADGEKDIAGNTMQFCLHFDVGNEAIVEQAYEVLSEGGTILVPLGPCVFSDCMTDIIDCHGVRWCLFTA